MAKLVKMFVNSVYNFGVVDNSKKAVDIVNYINDMINGWNDGSDLVNIKRDLHGLVDLINVYKPKMGIINTNTMFANRNIKYIVGNNLDNIFKSVAMTLGVANKEQKLLEKVRRIKDNWFPGTYVITNNGTKNLWFRATEDELDELGAEDLAILALMRKLKLKREVNGLLPNGEYDIVIESVDTWDNQENKFNDINFELKLEADKRIVSIINNRYDKDIIFNRIELLLDYARNSVQDLSKDPQDRFDNAHTSEAWIKAGYDIISDGWKDGVVPLFYLKNEIDPAIAGRFLIKELVDIFKNGERVYNILADESLRVLAETSDNKKVNYLPVNADFYEALTTLGVISPSFSEATKIIRSIASEKNGNDVIDIYDIESVIGFERGQKVLEWTKSIKHRLDKLQSVKDWTTVLNTQEKAMNIANIPEYLWNKTYSRLGPNEGPVILNLVEFFDEVNSKLEME